MNGILKNWMVRAGSRLPEITAAVFLIAGLLVTAWIVAGNGRVGPVGKAAGMKTASPGDVVWMAGEMGGR